MADYRSVLLASALACVGACAPDFAPDPDPSLHAVDASRTDAVDAREADPGAQLELIAQTGDDPVIVRLAVLETEMRGLRTDMRALRTDVEKLPAQADLKAQIAEHESRMLWSLFGAGITAGLTLAGILAAAGYFRRSGDSGRSRTAE